MTNHVCRCLYMWFFSIYKCMFSDILLLHRTTGIYSNTNNTLHLIYRADIAVSIVLPACTNLLLKNFVPPTNGNSQICWFILIYSIWRPLYHNYLTFWWENVAIHRKDFLSCNIKIDRNSRETSHLEIELLSKKLWIKQWKNNKLLHQLQINAYKGF